jgi:ABC-type metal ion transport system substrate-binding protein
MCKYNDYYQRKNIRHKWSLIKNKTTKQPYKNIIFAINTQTKSRHTIYLIASYKSEASIIQHILRNSKLNLV